MAINAADTRRTTHPPGVMTAGSRQVRSAIAKYARYICQMSAYTHPAKESYAAMQPPNTKPPNRTDPGVPGPVTMSDPGPGPPLKSHNASMELNARAITVAAKKNSA